MSVALGSACARPKPGNPPEIFDLSEPADEMTPFGPDRVCNGRGEV